VSAAESGEAGTGSAEAERALVAVAAAFFVVGLVLSAWFTQIPQFKARLGLGDGVLGLALFCPAAGALISMQAAGRLARRFGSAPLLRIASAAIGVTMLLVGAAPRFAWFAIGLVVFGLADGMCDVSMNAQAVAVEAALGRPILQRMHAAFSLGTLLGAISGALATWAKITPLGYLTGVAAGAVLIVLITSPRLLPAAADQAPSRPAPPPAASPAQPDPPAQSWLGRRGERAKKRGVGWSPFVIALGLLGAGCLLAEGAAQSWAAVFLRDQRHAAPALATAAYLVFTAVQFGGRLAGDRLHLRLGPVRLVQAGAAVAAAGLLLELLPSTPAVAICGVGVYSLGLCVLVPIIFGAVGHGSAERHDAASVTEAVAKFTTVSYLGYLLGPALIGALAQVVGLTWALTSVFGVLAAVIGWARLVASARPGQTARPSEEVAST
jgi:MFS family permease